MKNLKRFFCLLLIVLAGLLFVQLDFSCNKNLAEAATTEQNIQSAFSDNENLNALVLNTSIDLGTSFNVIDEVNLELYDQNPYGTCYATSLAQVLNLSYEYRTGEHIKISALALALQIRDLWFDEGANDLQVLETSYNLSYISEFDFPYELIVKYEEDLASDVEVVDFDFESKEIIDVSEYYMFPDNAGAYASSSDLYVETLKKALKTQGALGIGISYKVSSKNGHYIYDPAVTTAGNHAMTLVGYDDSFSKNNFISAHSSDGAFIILNSWGVNQELVYMSYEDVSALMFVYGVADFIEPDERNEEISNIDKNIYGLVDKFETNSSANGLKFGYQISNTTENSYLTEIDLQPVFNATYVNYYYKTTDVEVHIIPASKELSSVSYENLGTFDIGSGCTKIVLDEPILVGKDFGIRITVKDDSLSYGYLDRVAQDFETLFYNSGDWEANYYSQNNYNLIQTPYLLRVVLSDATEYQISKTDNHQVSNALQTVTYQVSSSNGSVDSVGYEIFKYDTVNAFYDKVEVETEDASNMFNVSSTSSSISLTPKAQMSGTFKLVINVNGGEKYFTKFITLDPMFDLTSFYVDPTTITADYEEYTYKYRLYSNALMADEINIEVPSYFDINHKNKYGNELVLDDAFLFNANTTATALYVVDANSRILKATVTFANGVYNTSHTLVVNFNYQELNKIIYVTDLPNATHSNPEYVAKDDLTELKPATAPNHRFLGWFTDTTFTDQRTSFTPIYDGAVIYFYALFEQIEINDFVQSVTYDDTTSIMTAVLDFSAYDLSIYDTIEFSSISHKFAQTHTASTFTTYLNDTYTYQVYVDKADLASVNSISFNAKIQRFNFKEYTIFCLNQTIEFTDVVIVNVMTEGMGSVTKSSNSLIKYLGDVVLNYKSTLSMAFVPAENYYISKVYIDGVSVSVTDSYTFSKITKNHTVKVVFASSVFTITTTITGKGSIGERSLVETVSSGSSLTYTFAADEGYYLDGIFIDGAKITTVETYTFESIYDNHSIVVVFKAYTFVVRATINGLGSIGQSLETLVEYGNDLTYTFAPSAGYSLEKIVVDGTEVPLAQTYTFENVKEDHYITVTFEKSYYIISIELNEGGMVLVSNADTNEVLYSITYSTEIPANHGTNLKYEFKPAEGYNLLFLNVDGNNISQTKEYYHYAVSADHSIEITFSIKTYSIVVNVVGEGFVNHSLSTTKNYGESINYVFTPKDGYQITRVTVNGSSIGAVSRYSIESIKANYSISVTFTIKTFTITWKNFDGSLLDQEVFDYGIYPAYRFNNPVREGSENLTYTFKEWNTRIDGLGEGLSPATANCTYYAIFEENVPKFKIKVSFGNNGTIAPYEDVMVNYGSNKSFDIVPDEGYHVSKLFIDGKIADVTEFYVFEDVKEEHTISAIFARNDFKATITNDEEFGEISGGYWFENGEQASFKITPAEGFKVKKVFVNGESVLVSNNSFVIESVKEDLEIIVEYEKTNSNSTIMKNVNNNIVYAIIAVVGIAVVVAVVFVVKHSKKREYV